jgi:chaperonin cofactor prefoldin
MKTYKKVNNKIYSTESIEQEVNIQSLNDRVETLDKTIGSISEQISKLNDQNNTYQSEKDELVNELKEISKL